MGVLLIVEGVTGAGKSRTIASLREWGRRSGHAVHVVDEEITLGTFLKDVTQPAWREQPVFPGLDAGLAAADRLREADPDAVLVLERFHLTAYALLGRWGPLAGHDRELAARGAIQILLDFHPRLIEQRSILRADRDGWADDMDQHYGSRQGAREAVRQSQARRRQGLLLSRLPFLHVDNGDGRWESCMAAVLAFCGLPVS